MSDDATLRAMADRQAITDVIYRYCRAMDRIDPELGYTVWHEDGEADYGADVYQGSGRGFIDWVCGTHRGAITHAHQVTNILIELDGDRAASEAYVFSDLRAGQGDQVKQITTFGRYVDQWSRRGGRWAIDKRIAIRDFAEMRDVTPMPLPERGRRDRSDPSYSVLRGPK
jgi:hypothetical protein